MKNRPRCFQTLAIVVSLMMVFPLNAEDVSELNDLREDIKDYQWQEQNESLPELPKAENLIPFAVVNRGYDNYSYSIDSASLSIGEYDGVRRYTVVITSRSGVRNLRYEAIRCETGEYKTYAYAVGDGAFRSYTAPKWQNIGREGSGRYRYTLFDEVYCRNYDTDMTLADILRTLRYPPESSTGVFE